MKERSSSFSNPILIDQEIEDLVVPWK